MAGTYANAAADVAYRKGPWPTGPGPDPVDPAAFHEVLDRYDDDVVFVHAGLSPVRQAFGTNPYEFLRDALDERFGSTLAPGYTPQFRRTGIYHKRYSEPAYGAWSRLLLGDADYRTDDAVHSILVQGDYRFGGCDHGDSFGPESPFAQLDRENVLVLNVGTRGPLTTQHHYVERREGVPYEYTTDHEGVLIRADGTSEAVVQHNTAYSLLARRAYRKLRSAAVGTGVVDRYDLNGLPVFAFRAGDYRAFLADRVADDPYYLVSAW